MNIYSILKSAGVCNSYTPEAKDLRKRRCSREAGGNRKDVEEIILMPEQPGEEKQTAFQRPFGVALAVTEVYFMACRYFPFSFV